MGPRKSSAKPFCIFIIFALLARARYLNPSPNSREQRNAQPGVLSSSLGCERGKLANRSVEIPLVVNYDKACGSTHRCTTGERLERFVSLFGSGVEDNWESIWQGRNLTHDEEGLPIPSQSRVSKFLLLTGASTSGTGVVVEMGTWMGKSTLALAAGIKLTAKQRGSMPTLYGFDFFSLKGMHLHKVPMHLQENMRKGGDFTEYWRSLVTSVGITDIVPIKGEMGEQTAISPSEWGNSYIDVFAIDSAKRHDQLRKQAKAVWPKLQYGSVVIFMDFIKTSQPLLTYHVLNPRGMLKLAWLSFSESPWAFIVTTANMTAFESAVNTFDPASVSTSERDVAYNRLKLDINSFAYAQLIPEDQELFLLRRARDIMMVNH